MFNEALLSAAKAEPRFVPLATLPMQDGARAASVLKSAMAAGFRGAMISTLPRGIGSVLDAPDLDPFWKAADDTGAVIHIHPAFDAGESRVHDYGLANGVGRVSDAVVAVSRLAMSGHVTRYKNAKVFVPIAAGGLPLVVGRLKRNHADHARHLRSGRGAEPDLHRHHRARPARASICHRDDGHRPCHARLRHAVSDRRPRADEDRRRMPG